MLASDPSNSPNNLPIAPRKGNHSIRNPYPIYNFSKYHHLSTSHHAFISAMSTVSISKSMSEALSHLGWCQAMPDEMTVLHTSGIFDLVP